MVGVGMMKPIVIKLSKKDQELLIKNILNPPEPTPALIKAFERREELFGIAKKEIKQNNARKWVLLNSAPEWMFFYLLEQN